MSWLVSAKQYIPAVIGEPFGGGYFAGYISHTANGVPTHALIVAPRATGATGTGYPITTTLVWKTASTTTAGATSDFDGVANTAAMVTAGIADHPAANFCVGLSIGGFTDWYLPARYELDIAYFNLKPHVTLNSTSWGINNYSVPKRVSNFTPSYPGITGLANFLLNTGGQYFVNSPNHWSSTDSNATNAYSVSMDSGVQTNFSGGLKTNLLAVRAFRRIAL